MIAGCYSLDLYCENYAINDGVHEYGEFPHVYTDEYGSRCRADARKDGWVLKLQEGKAICPKCTSHLKR